MKLDIAGLHHAVITSVVENGFAPSITSLAELFNCSRKKIRSSLKELQEYHGVVLHENSDEIWVIHPFSLAPTNFLVRQGGQDWWGNCGWCSLGIATLVGGRVEIITTLGADDRQVVIEVEGKHVSQPGLLVHFPTPMAKIWDNVVYSCSMMLVFETEDHIDKWCSRHNMPKGDIKRLDELQPFAAEWYGKYLDVNWKKWTVSEACELMDRHGFSGPTWALEERAGRF